jgi:hypothetical protein
VKRDGGGGGGGEGERSEGQRRGLSEALEDELLAYTRTTDDEDLVAGRRELGDSVFTVASGSRVRGEWGCHDEKEEERIGSRMKIGRNKGEGKESMEGEGEVSCVEESLASGRVM